MRHIQLPSLAATPPKLPNLPFHLHASTAGAALLVFLLVVLGLLLVLFRRNGRRQARSGTGGPAAPTDYPAALPCAAGGPEPGGPSTGQAEQHRPAPSQSLLGTADAPENERWSPQSAPSSAEAAEPEPAEQPPSLPGGATNGAAPEPSRSDLPQLDAPQPDAPQAGVSQAGVSQAADPRSEPEVAPRPSSNPKPGPAGEPAAKASDARDRLLGVLLADPGRALNGVNDLDACQGELDRLTESVHQQRRQLALVARRLRSAGLTSAQVAQLAGLGEGELATLLAEHAPSPTANHTRR